MAQVDVEKAKELMKRITSDVRAVINTHALEASEISVNSSDPHSPILGFMQMALAGAGTDYMHFCGATPTDAAGVTINITGQAMKQWTLAFMRQHNIQVKEPEKN